MAKVKIKEKCTITIDPYDKEGFKFSSKGIEPLDTKKSISKQNTFYSYLKFKDVGIATITIPPEIAEEDIANFLSLKAYEELTLDAEADYKISYFEAHSQSQDKSFNIFAVNNETLKNLFKDIVSKVPYIDYLTPAPLLYRALYKRGLAQPSNVDCFVCLQKDDAFLAVYSDGELLTSRSLRFTLEYLKEKFCEESGERISDDSFYNLLTTRGLKSTEQLDLDSKDDINTIFEDFLLYVNDTLSLISRIYNVTINNIYIDSQIGTIPNLDAIIKDRLDIEASSLNINFGLNTKEYNLSQQHNMLLLISKDSTQEEEYNFSLFTRPPEFRKRQSGRFVMTVAAITLLAALYPCYNYIAGYIMELDAQRLSVELTELEAEANRIKATLEKLAQREKEIIELSKKEDERFKFRENLLTEINYKKNSYAMKAQNIFNLSNMINRNGTQISNVKNTDRNMTLLLVSDDDKKITKLIQEIADAPEYSVDTKKIRFEKSKNNYESNLTIEIK